MALLRGKSKAEIVPVRTITTHPTPMSSEEFNGELPIDAPERKRLPLLLRGSIISQNTGKVRENKPHTDSQNRMPSGAS